MYLTQHPTIQFSFPSEYASPTKNTPTKPWYIFSQTSLHWSFSFSLAPSNLYRVLSFTNSVACPSAAPQHPHRVTVWHLRCPFLVMTRRQPLCLGQQLNKIHKSCSNHPISLCTCMLTVHAHFLALSIWLPPPLHLSHHPQMLPSHGLCHQTPYFPHPLATFSTLLTRSPPHLWQVQRLCHCCECTITTMTPRSRCWAQETIWGEMERVAATLGRVWASEDEEWSHARILFTLLCFILLICFPVTIATASKAAKKETKVTKKKKSAPKKTQIPDDNVLSFEQNKDLSEAIQMLDGQKWVILWLQYVSVRSPH